MCTKVASAHDSHVQPASHIRQARSTSSLKMKNDGSNEPTRSSAARRNRSTAPTSTNREPSCRTSDFVAPRQGRARSGQELTAGDPVHHFVGKEKRVGWGVPSRPTSLGPSMAALGRPARHAASASTPSARGQASAFINRTSFGAERSIPTFAAAPYPRFTSSRTSSTDGYSPTADVALSAVGPFATTMARTPVGTTCARHSARTSGGSRDATMTAVTSVTTSPP
jgi:hypothetical protein